MDGGRRRAGLPHFVEELEAGRSTKDCVSTGGAIETKSEVKVKGRGAQAEFGGRGVEGRTSGKRRGTTYSWAPGVCTAGGENDMKLRGVNSPGERLLKPGLSRAEGGIVESEWGSGRKSREGGVGGRR